MKCYLYILIERDCCRGFRFIILFFGPVVIVGGLRTMRRMGRLLISLGGFMRLSRVLIVRCALFFIGFITSLLGFRYCSLNLKLFVLGLLMKLVQHVLAIY